MTTKTKLATKPVVKAGTRTKEAPKDKWKEAKRLIETIQESWFDFSLIVAEIYNEQQWAAKGYKDFADCCKTEWGLEYKSALNRVKAGNAIIKFGITKPQAKQIGWTNFMEVSDLFDPEMKKSEIDTLLKKAGKLTHDELQRFKAEIRQTHDGPKGKKVKMTFTFTNEQADVVMNVLGKAKELMDVEFDDLALEYILVEWDASHDPDKADEIKSQLKGEVPEAEADDDEAEEAPAKAKGKAKPKAKAKAKAKPKAKAKTTKKKAKDDDDEDDDDLLEDPDEVDDDDTDDTDDTDEGGEEDDDDDDLLDD